MTVAEIERIGAPQITRQDARRAFLDYRRAVGSATGERKREYEGLMRGYKAIAAGKQVIDLHGTMTTAGLQHDTAYPRLAICRADASKCFVRMGQNGSARFMADSENVYSKAKSVLLPESTFQRYTYHYERGYSNRPQGWREVASALVPIVPPQLQPERGGLALYHILWDAVWTPEPPRDPLLLRHLSGHLYAILAAWDLSPLERAVMRGRL